MIPRIIGTAILVSAFAQSGWQRSNTPLGPLERQFGSQRVHFYSPSGADPGDSLLEVAGFTGDDPEWLLTYIYEGMDQAGMDIRREEVEISATLLKQYRAYRQARPDVDNRFSQLLAAATLTQGRRDPATAVKVARFRLPSPPTSFRISLFGPAVPLITIQIRKVGETTISASLLESM